MNVKDIILIFNPLHNAKKNGAGILSKTTPYGIGRHVYTPAQGRYIMDNINEEQDKLCTLANKMCKFKTPLKIKHLATNLYYRLHTHLPMCAFLIKSVLK